MSIDLREDRLKNTFESSPNRAHTCIYSSAEWYTRTVVMVENNVILFAISSFISVLIKTRLLRFVPFSLCKRQNENKASLTSHSDTVNNIGSSFIYVRRKKYTLPTTYKSRCPYLLNLLKNTYRKLVQ